VAISGEDAVSFGSALIIGEHEKAALAELRRLAAENPVNVVGLFERIQTPDGKRAHMAQMDAQTVDLPMTYLVTFSIENGHPIGTCRHMSMSSTRKGRAPNQYAVWMVAEELGFVVGLETCTVWTENLQRGAERAIAINVVQPLMVNVMQNPS
jgi:hypothetical protein